MGAFDKFQIEIFHVRYYLEEELSKLRPRSFSMASFPSALPLFPPWLFLSSYIPFLQQFLSSLFPLTPLQLSIPLIVFPILLSFQPHGKETDPCGWYPGIVYSLHIHSHASLQIKDAIVIHRGTIKHYVERTGGGSCRFFEDEYESSGRMNTCV